MKRLIIALAICGLVITSTAGAEIVKWIPAAASNAGALGTYWTTDLWIYSQVQDAATEIHIAFLPEGVENPDLVEETVQIPAYSMIHLTDVVATLFGESRPGALRLRSDLAFSARSRTFNSGGENGTFGQGIEAVPDDGGPGSLYPGDPGSDRRGWVLMGAVNHPGESGARSNIGLFNTLSEERDVTLLVFDQATNALLGSDQITLGAFGWFQTDLFTQIGLVDVDVDDAFVLALGRVGIRGYLSQIDNLSGDGTFITAADASPVYAIRADWQISMTVTVSESVTIDSFIYTGQDGSDVGVENPESGATIDVTLTPPLNFCYHVTATADERGGNVQMEFLSQRGDDSAASSDQSHFIGGSGQIVLAKCVPLY
jgi:hypothetical protein